MNSNNTQEPMRMDSKSLHQIAFLALEETYSARALDEKVYDRAERAQFARDIIHSYIESMHTLRNAFVVAD